MTRKRVAFDLTIIALLAALAYAPSLSIPLMEDDYPNLAYAIKHGPSGGIALLADPIFRVRATSTWLMYGLWQAFGLVPAAYHAVSVLLHVANCWLVYGIVRSRFPAVSATAAVWTAAFFAVAEGHQEAVMWFSACNELLAFLFGAGALLCWLIAGRQKQPGRRLAWSAASVVAFALALLSKESAVMWLPLFLVASAPEWRRSIVRLLPHAVLAGLAIASVVSTRAYSFRFSDGSFSLSAPFWITWTRGMLRLLWVWGWLSLAALVWIRDGKAGKTALAALVWMAIGLAPYMFLTYSTQIPSRQTYLASAGLALLFGLAMARLRAAPARARNVATVAALVMVISNTGYLWTRKRAQFRERAEPTEQLIRMARQTTGTIWVLCFPRNRFIAEEAVEVAAGRSPKSLVWSAQDAARRGAAAKFCYRQKAN